MHIVKYDIASERKHLQPYFYVLLSVLNPNSYSCVSKNLLLSSSYSEEKKLCGSYDVQSTIYIGTVRQILREDFGSYDKKLTIIVPLVHLLNAE